MISLMYSRGQKFLARLTCARVIIRYASLRAMSIRQPSGLITILMSFQTHYDSYEFMVMPFEFTNAPTTFMTLMNTIFHDMLDRGVIVFLDDILIYAKDINKHNKLLAEVLHRLWQNGLYAKPSKCLFGIKEVKFLGAYHQ